MPAFTSHQIIADKGRHSSSNAFLFFWKGAASPVRLSGLVNLARFGCASMSAIHRLKSQPVAATGGMRLR